MKRTVAEYRAARAVELSLQGQTYREIAAELGFADPSGAWRAVRRCLRRRQVAAADEYLRSNLVDLQILIEKHWPRAVAGDIHAAEVILSAMERQRQTLELVSTQGSQEAQPPRSAQRVHRSHEMAAGVFASMVV